MKEKLRKELLNKRQFIENKQSKDEKIIKNLNLFLEKYDKIMIYYPISSEPQILPIISVEEKEFYLPYCKNKEIEIRKLIDVNDLERDEENILSSKVKTDDKISVVIVPAVGMNLKMYRLGYGGGYYDKFFQNNQYIKVAVVYDELIIDEDFQDNWDIKFDYIITEKEIIKGK